MTLAPGTRLGVYQVTGLLGEGGMGAVYHARDTRLDREVALKILPDLFASDPERLARFEREAKTLAALNHPHIAQIHHLEQQGHIHALVMELVAGDDLSQRIARGPIPVDEALSIARQIADALEAAHERGIIHRDLKPANIKVRDDGTVKVLDFGLAKAMESGAGKRDSGVGNALADSPTLTSPAMTQAGIILGTAAYMAPEQAKGRAVDKRADIWAFGCVLYEMLTGRRAFEGQDIADVLSRVLQLEPDLTALAPPTPPGVRALIARCLIKDPRQRLRDIGDARLMLDGIFDSPPSPTAASIASPKGRLRHFTIAMLLGIAVGASAVWWTTFTSTRSEATSPRAITRFSVPLPRGALLADDQPAMALSPDGRTAVVAADDGGGVRLYVRDMSSLTMTALEGTAQGHEPFFSPDGQWIGFYSRRKLRKVALSGGAPQEVCDAVEPYPAAWSDDGFIFFTETSGGGLSRVPAAGGIPEIATTPRRDRREKIHIDPSILPGGATMLLTVGNADITSFDDADIDVLTLATGQRKTLIKGGMNPRYVATGHLIYARAGSLLAVPFDLSRLEVTGPPRVVASDVRTDPIFGAAAYAVSRDGSLLYAPGSVNSYEAQLMWFDRAGRSEAFTDLRRAFTGVQLSPDGSRVALEINAPNTQLWIYDIARATTTRLTSGWDNMNGIWSPDGKRLTFQSNRETTGAYGLFSQAADGAGSAERLPIDTASFQYPTSWAPDGRHLVFSTTYPSPAGLWIWSATDRQARPYLRNASHGRVSPDGHWIAFQSAEAGDRSEVFVQQFPGPSRQWTVSTSGGTLPLWARDGRELYYRAAGWMMGVRVETRPEFSVGRPQRLFKWPNAFDVLRTSQYDVAADGRFLMIQGEPQSISQVNVVLNWFEELKTHR